MRHGISAFTFLCMAFAFNGCQRSDERSQQIHSTIELPQVALIQAKVIPVALPQNEICEQVGCTQYEFQTIQTRQAWIDDYFLNRLKKMEPMAFEKYEGPDLDRESLSALGLSQSRAHVRYLGQNAHIASFVLHSYQYNSGADHGIYHHEYVNFDLNERKRIGLNDILMMDQLTAFAEALYQHNKTWLLNRNISFEAFQLSDNFYYGTQGLVLVYPLYQWGGYADGMSELVLPYSALTGFVKEAYLPALPDYAVANDVTQLAE